MTLCPGCGLARGLGAGQGQIQDKRIFPPPWMRNSLNCHPQPPFSSFLCCQLLSQLGPPPARGIPGQAGGKCSAGFSWSRDDFSSVGVSMTTCAESWEPGPHAHAHPKKQLPGKLGGGGKLALALLSHCWLVFIGTDKAHFRMLITYFVNQRPWWRASCLLISHGGRARAC